MATNASSTTWRLKTWKLFSRSVFFSIRSLKAQKIFARSVFILLRIDFLSVFYKQEIDNQFCRRVHFFYVTNKINTFFFLRPILFYSFLRRTAFCAIFTRISFLPIFFELLLLVVFRVEFPDIL